MTYNRMADKYNQIVVKPQEWKRIIESHDLYYTYTCGNEKKHWR